LSVASRDDKKTPSTEDFQSTEEEVYPESL